MPFRETLRGIVEDVEGGLGAVIMGYDGIAIDEYLKQDAGIDLHLLAVEYATVMKEVRRTVEVLGTGDMEEMTVNTGRTTVVVRILGEDLFLFLALDRDGNHGKGRYLLRREAPGLAASLS